MTRFVNDSLSIAQAFLILLIAIIGASVFVTIKDEMTSNQTEQYCVIDDKYSKRTIVGTASTKKYCIDVHVTDNEELTDTITVPYELYEAVEVGDEVKCVLFYTDDKLVKIEVSD